MLTNIRYPKILLLSIILIYGLSTYQFQQDYSKFKTLRERGIITETTAKFLPKKIDADCYKFSFVTADGQTISETGKCGDKKKFDEFYSNLEVIYDPNNPNVYLEKPYFDNYSLPYKIFFFILYGLIGTMVLYGIIKTIYFLSDKENRRELKKNIAQQNLRKHGEKYTES